MHKHFLQASMLHCYINLTPKEWYSSKFVWKFLYFKTKLHCFVGLCEGDSPVTGGFPSQRANNTEFFSIWWRHHKCHRTPLMISSGTCNGLMLVPLPELMLTQIYGVTRPQWVKPFHAWYGIFQKNYRKVSNIRCTFVGNEIVDHSDVVGASPVGAAPTTSLFST